MASPQWSETFFSGLWIEFQNAVWPDERSRADAVACQELLQLLPSQRVLDVPCGNGRVAVELARRGLTVSGLDITDILLSDAAGKADAEGVDLDLHRGDMRDMPFESRTFAGVVCLWSSIGYRQESDDEAFFAEVARVLEPGGRFVLDTQCAETLLSAFTPEQEFAAGPIRLHERRRFEPATARVEVEWTLSKDGRRERKHSSIRIYSYRELAERLATVGLTDLSAFGSLDLEPFEVGASRLVLVATLAG